MCPVNLAVFYEPLDIPYIKDKISNIYVILLQLNFEKSRLQVSLQSSLTPKPNSGFILSRKDNLIKPGQLQEGFHVGRISLSKPIP